MKCLVVLNLILGLNKPRSTSFCPNSCKKTESIIEASKSFDYTFVINDTHYKDDFEFKYLPPHKLENSSDSKLDKVSYSKIKSKYKQILIKNTMNAFQNNNNYELLSNVGIQKITLSGFNCTTDIIPTALFLIDAKWDVSLLENGIGDMTEKLNQNGLDYLHIMGVPTI